MTFPISFLMNKWLLVQRGGYAHSAAPANTHEELIGVAPFFTPCHMPILTAAEIREASVMLDNSNYERVRERNKQLSFDQAYDLALTYREKYKNWLAEIERNQSNQPLCQFESSKGTIAIPLPFDTMVHAVALAQQGKIVRIHTRAHQTVPDITAISPSLPQLTRVGLRPAGRKP